MNDHRIPCEGEVSLRVLPFHTRMWSLVSRERRIAPNEVLWFGTVIALEIKRSAAWKDFPLGVNGLHYVLDQAAKYPGTRAYVRFLDWDGQFMTQTTAQLMNDLIAGFPLVPGFNNRCSPHVYVNFRGVHPDVSFFVPGRHYRYGIEFRP